MRRYGCHAPSIQSHVTSNMNDKKLHLALAAIANNRLKRLSHFCTLQLSFRGAMNNKCSNAMTVSERLKGWHYIFWSHLRSRVNSSMAAAWFCMRMRICITNFNIMSKSLSLTSVKSQVLEFSKFHFLHHFL